MMKREIVWIDGKVPVSPENTARRLYLPIGEAVCGKIDDGYDDAIGDYGKIDDRCQLDAVFVPAPDGGFILAGVQRSNARINQYATVVETQA